MDNMKNNVFSNTIKYTFIRVLTMGVTLLNTMLLSRFRTLEEYGTFSQILLVVNLGVSLFMIGIPNSMNYFVANESNKKDRNRVLSIYYTINTILSIILGAILNATSSLIAGYFKNELILDYVYFLSVLPWISVITVSLENILIVYEKMNWLTVFKVLSSIFILSVAVLAKVFSFSFSEYMILYTGVQVFFTILVYVIGYKVTEGELRFVFDWSIVKKILCFSIPLGVGALLNTLNIEIDKLMVSRWYSVEELAIYTNASTELPIYILNSSLTVIALPKIVSYLKDGATKKAIELWREIIWLGYIVLSFLAIGMITFSEEVILLIYSEKYLPGQAVFIIYTINLLVYRCTYYGLMLNAGGKSKQIMFASAITVLANIILNPIMHTFLGFEGPAVASLIAIILSNILLLVFSKRVFLIKIAEVFPIKQIGGITILNVVMAMVFFNLKQVIGLEMWFGEIVESILLAGVWGIIYFLLVIKELKKVSMSIKTK